MTTAGHQGPIAEGIARAAQQFERDWMGIRYTDVRVALVHEAVLIHLRGCTPSQAEWELVRTPHGRAVVKQMYRALFDECRDALAKTVSALLDVPVQEVFMDMNVCAGEKVIVLTLEAAPKAALSSEREQRRDRAADPGGS